LNAFGYAIIAGVLVSVPLVAYATRGVKAQQGTYPLYFHIKNDPNVSVTQGKVKQVFNNILKVNQGKYFVGLEPECVTDWNTELNYYSEFSHIPTMISPFTSDNAKQLSLDQTLQAIQTANVTGLRFHEVISYYGNTTFPTDYALSLIKLAQDYNIPVFWNEWNIYTFDQIASIIQGYEDTVIVSFGTNNAEVEPSEGYQLLQRFQRKGASVQSYYWYERNGRVPGYEYTMPPQLMAEFTKLAISSNLEMVQLEPFNYFFNFDTTPRTTLKDYFGEI